jgi:hypothetical protein
MYGATLLLPSHAFTVRAGTNIPFCRPFIGFEFNSYNRMFGNARRVPVYSR